MGVGVVSCLLEWLRAVICRVLSLIVNVLSCIRNGVCNAPA
ncbi:hypothetical protein [Bacillus haikouensis]|jgi:hypothetical protein|nr:hypothetical protein [Bacillus haikouensis]